MNYIHICTFYGLGLSIEAVSDAEILVPYIDEDTEVLIEVHKTFNGLLVDFLFFRLMLGNIK